LKLPRNTGVKKSETTVRRDEWMRRVAFVSFLALPGCVVWIFGLVLEAPVHDPSNLSAGHTRSCLPAKTKNGRTDNYYLQRFKINVDEGIHFTW